MARLDAPPRRRTSLRPVARRTRRFALLPDVVRERSARPGLGAQPPAATGAPALDRPGVHERAGVAAAGADRLHADQVCYVDRDRAVRRLAVAQLTGEVQAQHLTLASSRLGQQPTLLLLRGRVSQGGRTEARGGTELGSP